MEEEISPTISLHRFIAVCKTDEQVEQLRLAILSGGSEFDLAKTDDKGYSALHWAGKSSLTSLKNIFLIGRPLICLTIFQSHISYIIPQERKRTEAYISQKEK